jgi:hypothetical protein
MEKKRQSLSPREKRQRVIDKYKIYHHPEWDRERWPRHRDIFDNIQKLGDYKFEDWRKDIYIDSSRPWRQETKQRAEIIVEFARHCRKDRVNEESWRRRLEHYIFLRFELEVTW